MDMIKTKNEGIKRMGLVRRLRWRYEARLKAKRDRWAEDEFVKDQGRAEGLAIGEARGKAKGLAEGLVIGEARGRARGKAEDILLILSTKGDVSVDLHIRIREEIDTDVLNDWVRVAVMAKDTKEFREKIR